MVCSLRRLARVLNVFLKVLHREFERLKESGDEERLIAFHFVKFMFTSLTDMSNFASTMQDWQVTGKTEQTAPLHTSYIHTCIHFI